MTKDRAASTRAWAVGVLVVAGVSACGGKVDETPVKRTPASCYAMCVRITEPKCGGDELTSCTSNCKALESGSCAKLLQSALDCAWYDATYSCVDGGDRAVMLGCDGPWQAYLACASAPGEGGS